MVSASRSRAAGSERGNLVQEQADLGGEACMDDEDGGGIGPCRSVEGVEGERNWAV